MINNNSKKFIPEGWRTHTISDLCDNLDGRRVPITKSDRVSGGIPYYGATGIIDYVDGYIFNEEILLIGEDGADWSPFASKAFMVIGKSWVNNHAHVLKCKDGSTHEYLKQYLNWKNLDVYTTGGTRKKLNKEVLMNIPVCLPKSKKEQQKIAGILGTVDENIEKTQEVINETEKLKQGLMQQLFTRGIGHMKFKKTKMGEIPERWEVAQLGDLFNSIIGGGTPSRKESKYWSGDIPWMTVKDMTKKKYVYDTKEYITEIGLKDSSSSLIPENNLITSTRMGIGRVYINKIPVAINQDLKGLVPKKEFILDYVYWLILSVAKKLETKGTGSTVKGIRLEDFKSLDIALTESRSEQKQIAENLSAVDEKISINKKLKDKLTLLKKGLMQDLLSGRVRWKNLC